MVTFPSRETWRATDVSSVVYTAGRSKRKRQPRFIQRAGSILSNASRGTVANFTQSSFKVDAHDETALPAPGWINSSEAYVPWIPI